jgi:hypothetical protein
LGGDGQTSPVWVCWAEREKEDVFIPFSFLFIFVFIFIYYVVNPSLGSSLVKEKSSYSLQPILLFANTDISITKMCLDTSILAKNIMGQREYKNSSQRSHNWRITMRVVDFDMWRSLVLYRKNNI